MGGVMRGRRIWALVRLIVETQTQEIDEMQRLLDELGG
jgi:uncharacterized protein (DUF305 family)